ncbi:PEPxxWA-CTERM sorting domain-containing protein [Sphingomonas tabacisoli]|uniref:PEPxxWA-CTERM sorting domain-containing protein n=1 Tax=Sphingomonas tabacisoli TaxID=2249466 RepID=A0ABW4I7S7_9SPHN
MKTTLFLLATASALVSATPSAAAVIIDFNNVQTAENVLFSSSTSVASPTVTGQTNQTHVDVTFANILGLLKDASGQSSTTNAGGTLRGTTSVNIASGFTFTAAEFQLPGNPGNPPPPEANSVFVEAFGLGGGVIGTATLALDGNGENRIRIVGNAGEVFTGFRVTLSPQDAVTESMKQVRLGGVAAAVPEPATWAMMLGGFGLLGAAARRRHRTTVTFA